MSPLQMAPLHRPLLLILPLAPLTIEVRAGAIYQETWVLFPDRNRPSRMWKYPQTTLEAGAGTPTGSIT